MKPRGTGRPEHVGEDHTYGSPLRQCNSPDGKHAVPSGQSPSLSCLFDFPCIAAPRPRLLTKGRVYMPKRYQRWKDNVRMAWMAKNRDVCLGKHLSVGIQIYSKTPPPGDLDNYAKGVLDALRGLVFEDDSAKHVSRLRVEWVEHDQKGFLVTVSSH